MDELGGFEPTDTSGFIQIESIRIKKSSPVHFVTSNNLTPLSDGLREISSKGSQGFLRRRHTSPKSR